MMVTLRPWPVRRRLRTARRLPVRPARRDGGGEARLPRFRFALVWRCPRLKPPVSAENRSTTFVQLDNRLHLVLAWSAELRVLIERIIQTAPRQEPAVRILTRLGPVMTLRSSLPRLREPDLPHTDRGPLPSLRPPQETRPEFSSRHFALADRNFAPRLARAALASRADSTGSAQHTRTLAWPLRRFAWRVRKDAAAELGVPPTAAPRRIYARRRPINVPRLFASLVTDEVKPAQTVRRVFRRTAQPVRPVAAPRRVDMVWRKAPLGETTRSETISHNVRRAASAPAASKGWTAPPGPTSLSAAASVPRSAGAAAIQIDPATMNRLTHEVIGRIEQRLRVERERRGG
jgi:hypothetical protein